MHSFAPDLDAAEERAASHPSHGSVSDRFQSGLFALREQADARIFWLLIAQWAVTLVTSFAMAGRWTHARLDTLSSAVIWVGILSVVPLAMVLRAPGSWQSRWAVVVSQGVMSSLLWYVSGGRPDTHLHLFAWLVVLALYRDVWSVLSLVAISMTGHLLVMIGSVLPALATDPSPWTSVLWMSWLVGEAAFLVTFVAIDRQALKSQVDREAALEALQTKFQGKLESLTRQLVTERDSLQVEVTSLKETTAAAVSARTNAVQTLEALRHDVSSQGMEILRLASRPADSSLNKEWRTVWLALRRRAQHLTRLVDLSALEPDRGERSSFGDHSKDQHESVGHLSGDKRAMLLIRNPVQQNKATAALEALGYKVDVVTSGPKTYYSVMLNDYSTIVVDIDLPGDEGFDTLEALRLLPPGRIGATKCLFALTAEMTPDRVLRCTNLNVDGMLLKPLHTDALRKALHPEGHSSRERRRPHRSTSTSTQRR